MSGGHERHSHPAQWPEVARRIRPRARGPTLVDLNISTTDLALALAAGVVGAGYIGFILMPAMESYGRVWEKLAAGFLSLFILMTLLGTGAAIGLAVVWSYDRYA